MAIAMLLPSVFPKWFTPAGDSVLSGGVLEFYEVGTTTPKSVYADYQQNAPIGNVVTLNGAGEATIFLGSGGYKVILKDELGAQLDLVDGIFGSGGVGTIPSTANYVFLLNYDELRALSTTVDVAYVAGRTNEGDGGEGWFQRLPGVTAHDDDGVFLSSVGGSIQYRRIFDAAIDPRWYGVEYGSSADQKDRFESSFSGSAETGCPVLVVKQISLGQSVTIPVGTIIECSPDGFFYAANSASMTFETGSRFSGVGVCFLGSLQPSFAAGTISELRLSWFGGADGTKWTRAISSTSAKTAFKMDISTSVTSSVAVPANLPLTPENGAILSFAAPGDLSIGALEHSTTTQFVSYGSAGYILSVSIGSPVCYMEWFGGSASNSGNDNATPFKACCAAKRLDLREGFLNYTVTSSNPFTISDFVSWHGNNSRITLNQTITVTGIYLYDIQVWGSGSITHSSCIAYNANITTPLLSGPVELHNSTVNNPDWVVKADNSSIYNPKKISGKLNACQIVTDISMESESDIFATSCKIQKTGAGPVFILIDDDMVARFIGCLIQSESTFIYSSSALNVITIEGCTNPEWSNGQAIHNGIATVNVIGCGVRGNSTATTNDGEVCRRIPVLGDPYIESPMIYASGTSGLTSAVSAAKWRGVGSPSFATTYMTLGDSVALDSTPWGMNTMRYADLNADGSGTVGAPISDMWRYGGQISVEIEYPANIPPDPESRLTVAFVVPTIGVEAPDSIITRHHILGEITAPNLPPINGAKTNNVACVWGGQVDIGIPNGLEKSCDDEWGDVSFKKWGPNTVPGIPRIVIYDKGNRVTPAGTKFRIYMGAYMPTTAQYAKFWPDTPFAYVDGIGTQSVRPNPTNVGGLVKIPYVFRSGDANGVQIAPARVNYSQGVGYPNPTNLPVTVWANGTTLNGSYS